MPQKCNTESENMLLTSSRPPPPTPIKGAAPARSVIWLLVVARGLCHGQRAASRLRSWPASMAVACELCGQAERTRDEEPAASKSAKLTQDVSIWLAVPQFASRSLSRCTCSWALFLLEMVLLPMRMSIRIHTTPRVISLDDEPARPNALLRAAPERLSESQREMDMVRELALLVGGAHYCDSRRRPSRWVPNWRAGAVLYKLLGASRRRERENRTRKLEWTATATIRLSVTERRLLDVAK